MANGIGAAILEGATLAQMLSRLSGGMENSKIERAKRHPVDIKRKRELERLKSMPIARAFRLYKKKAVEFNADNEKFYAEIRQSRADTRARYDAMLAIVKAWRAPRTLAYLKEGLLRQIAENIGHDCQPVGGPGEPWTAASMIAWELENFGAAAKRDAREFRKEQRRVKERNAAIRALRRTLKRLNDKDDSLAATA